MIKKLSIVIPTYNVAKYIDECANSIVNINSKKINVVLVDDRGSDNSIEIAENILKAGKVKYKVIKNKKNVGVGLSIQNGIDGSDKNTTHFLILDPDDRLSSEFKIEQVKNADLTCFKKFGIMFKNQYKTASTISKNFGVGEHKLRWNYWNFIISRDLIKKTKFDSRGSSDTLPVSEIITKSKNIDFVETKLTDYRLRKSSAVRSKSGQNTERIAMIKTYIKAYNRGYFDKSSMRYIQILESYYYLPKSMRKEIDVKKLPSYTNAQKFKAWFAINMQKLVFFHKWHHKFFYGFNLRAKLFS